MLDFKMPGMDTPEGQGLLAAAFSLLQARKMPGDRGIGGALGAAGQQYMGTRSQAQDQMQRRKLLDAQMAAQQAEVEQRQAAMKRQAALDAEAARKAEEDKRIRGLVANAGSVRPGMGAGLPDGLLPPELSTGQSFPALQKPGQIDYQSLFQQGVPLEMLKGLAETPNLGRPEVARTIKGMVGGREVDQQFDKFGRPVGQGMEQYKAPIMLDRGGQTDALSPYTQPGASFPKTMTFADRTAQGQLGVSQANLGLARDRLAFEKAGGAAGTKGTAEEQKKVADAKDVLTILDTADGVLKDSTSSYVGAGIDQLARGVGFGTSGANAAARLKALEGLLVSKMPKMSGPQSDKDVLLYKQMAGQIGDSTLPISTRQSAIETIREINQRYAGVTPAPQTGGAQGTWDAPKKPDWVFKNGKLVKAN
jgi:hypothetical protein